MNKNDYDSAQIFSHYLGLSALDDAGPFWQNRIFVEQKQLDFEGIELLGLEEIHPFFD